MMQMFLMINLSDLKLNEATRTTSDVFRVKKKQKQNKNKRPMGTHRSPEQQ